MLQSPEFEAYYAAQGIVQEEEWEVFLRALKSPLPMVLRVNRCRDGWEAASRHLRECPVVHALPWMGGD